jgi:hypothetical protein
MPDAYPIHCHKCSAWIGETTNPMEPWGLFRSARDRESVPPPRNSWRCKGCGWVNVFRVSKIGKHGSWREVEVKG